MVSCRYANKLVATMLPCSGGPRPKHTYLLTKGKKGPMVPCFRLLKPQDNQNEWICGWVREFDYNVCLRKNLQPPDGVTRLLTDDLVWPGCWNTLRSLNGNQRTKKKDGQPKSKPKSRAET
ncbi:hypothetical protein QR685DRAFT_568472 [Neurospora intermedia]|uniref:Uncharacterized protein n=1 Tax=Neurospora intermedia TaxID=5142 RepID=A0ABR3DV09_NEUIN